MEKFEVDRLERVDETVWSLEKLDEQRTVGYEGMEGTGGGNVFSRVSSGRRTLSGAMPN